MPGPFRGRRSPSSCGRCETPWDAPPGRLRNATTASKRVSPTWSNGLRSCGAVSEIIKGQLLDRFADMAAKGGWNVYRSPGVEDAVGYIETLARRLNVQRAVRSGQPVFDGIPVDAAFSNNGATITTMVHGDAATRQSLREEVRQAGLGLTGADYALAETGSIVILPRRGLSRLVSLVPPVHVALVRPEELLESLDDLFLLRRLEYYRNGGEMGSYLNFITGPSRTADIEMTIVQGVHGPKEVHLVLLG